MAKFTKAEIAMKLMKDYFWSLPSTPLREEQLSAREYLSMKNDACTSDIKLGARASMLCKSFGYRIDSKLRDNPSDYESDWPTPSINIYPKRILDAAYWFVTLSFIPKLSAKQELSLMKEVFSEKEAELNKSAKVKRTCVDCGEEYETEHGWCIRCFSCYKKVKAKAA